MAIGGLGAYWVFNLEKKQLETHFLFSKKIQIVVLSLIASLIFFKINLSQSASYAAQLWKFIFNPLTYPIVSSLLFLHLILNVSLNKDSFIKTENRIFNFLGEISYGLYMYHILVVYVVIKVLGKQISGLHPLLFTVILYSIVLSLLVLVCHFSFKYFEKPIIRLKNRLK
jgi:peptidoglycan/LPS O-acetylase OafA/YrhL